MTKNLDEEKPALPIIVKLLDGTSATTNVNPDDGSSRITRFIAGKERTIEPTDEVNEDDVEVWIEVTP